MEQVIKTIRETLESIHTDVYFKRVGNKPPNPYIVFKTPSDSPEEYNRDDVTVEIDIWGDDNSNPSVYALSDSIESVLNMKRVLTADHLLMFPNAQRLEIPDPNPKIERIQLRYIVRKHK
jgi:hypothetical protein